jgi:hypothetical protein
MAGEDLPVEGGLGSRLPEGEVPLLLALKALVLMLSKCIGGILGAEGSW